MVRIDMDMPVTCMDCPFSAPVGGVIRCNLSMMLYQDPLYQDDVAMIQRHEDCPLYKDKEVMQS